MVKKGLRKSVAERIALAEAKKKKQKTTKNVLIGTGTATAVGALAAAIYAVCRLLKRKKKEA